MCYTYDDLSRVTVKTTINLADNTQTQETYSYDAAGNITAAPESSFNYLNNRLITYNGQGVSFDADGNMTSALMGEERAEFEYDFSNRLISAGDVDYTYNAENTRIRTQSADYDTTYTYNTNCKLSQLLLKTTNGFETKYVYGLGLIGEEKAENFKTYHFDYRGSTVAITDMSGSITDTFKYDAYGKLTERTGTSYVIFRYNGRDGAVSDRNGLVYMRARYYSPEHKRFVNADILHGGITDSTSLNRYAYVNGNPVSFVDPTGMSVDENRGNSNSVTRSSGPIRDVEGRIVNLVLINDLNNVTQKYKDTMQAKKAGNDIIKGIVLHKAKFEVVESGDYLHIKGKTKPLHNYNIKQRRIRADNIKNFDELNGMVNPKMFDTPGVVLDIAAIGVETIYEVSQYEDAEDKWIVGTYTAGTGAISAVASAGATWAITKWGATIGTGISPGLGTAIGAAVGLVVGLALDAVFDSVRTGYIKEIVENN